MTVPFRFRDLPPDRQMRIKEQMKRDRRLLSDLTNALGDRLPESRRNSIHSTWFHGGEYGMAMNELVQTLVYRQIPLSVGEANQVAEVLAEFGTCDGREPFMEDHAGALAVMKVVDSEGRQLSPPPDFDPARWIPRRLARALYGRTGGHLHEGRLEDAEVPHRTVFPAAWDAEKVDALVLDVARNPDEVPEQTRGGGWVTRGTREAVVIEARLRPDGPILAGYPLSGTGVRRVGALSEPPVRATQPPAFPLPAGATPMTERVLGWRADLDLLHADCKHLVVTIGPALPPVDQRRVSTGLAAGELLYLVDDLLAALVQERIPITVDDRAQLVTTLDRLGLGDEDSPYLRDRDATLKAISVG